MGGAEGPGPAPPAGSSGAGPRWLLPGPAEVMAARGGAGSRRPYPPAQAALGPQIGRAGGRKRGGEAPGAWRSRFCGRGCGRAG